MYNSLTRLQAVFGAFTSVAFVLAGLVAVSDLMAPRAPSGTLRTTNVQVVHGRPNYHSTKKEEYAIVRFSLDADLSSLFSTWNTKSVFVYVTADWPAKGAADANAANATNSAVIWDSIITAPSADHLANVGRAALRKLRKSAEGKSIDPNRGMLHLENQKPKYNVGHPSGRVAETDDVTLHLHYSVQPWVGLLTWNQGRDVGLWKALQGGASSAFALPAIKDKDKPKAKAEAR